MGGRHNSSILIICSSAPEISRYIKEVAPDCTVTKGLSTNKHTSMVRRILVTERQNHIVFKTGFPICARLHAERQLNTSRHAFQREMTATSLRAFTAWGDWFLSAQRWHVNRRCFHNQPWHYSSVAHIMEVSPDHTLNIHGMLLQFTHCNSHRLVSSAGWLQMWNSCSANVSLRCQSPRPFTSSHFTGNNKCNCHNVGKKA